ncbi:uncharacterized protein LOC136027054 [Artemia franciscana]|uniref:DUF7789 domain-containing protein n=1 Tax=Artemia franciscana TaxID=6661 RepID=A0AA88KW98_ARTSF|nr:hypothetical protein QYM36_013365 [Artemia franciscana]
MTSDEGVALLTTASPPDYSSRGATLQTPSSENVMNRRVNETILKTVPGLRKTFFGKFKSFELIEREEWLFLFFSLMSIMTTVCFTIYRLCFAAAINPKSDDVLLGIILLINTVFCLYHLLHGVFRDQYFDIMTFLLTTAAVIGYVFLNFFGKDESTNVNRENFRHPTVKLARLIVTCLLGMPVICLGVVIVAKYWRSNYILFRLVGGRTDLQLACGNVLLIHTLLSLAVNSMLSFLVAKYYMDMIDGDTAVIFTYFLYSGVACLWATLGYLSLRFEKKLWIVWFIMLGFLPPTLTVFDTIQVSHEDNIFTTIRFGAILISTIIACSSCLLLILAALYALKFCNIGLSERMYSMDDEDAWRIVTTLRQPDVEVGEGRVE